MNKKIFAILLFDLLLGSIALVSCMNPDLKPVSENQPSLESARSGMIDFLNYLNQENYAEAAKIYGGELEILRGYNPDVDPEDDALLMEYGCKFNGIQCMQLKTVVSEEQTDDKNFVFNFLTFVEVINPNFISGISLSL